MPQPVVTPPAAVSTPERKLPVASLAVLAMALFAAVLTEVLPVGLMPLLSESFGVGEDRIGWWVSAYAFVVAISAIPLTATLARWPRRRALLVLLGLYAASNALILVAPTFWVGLAGRVVGGVAHAGIFSVAIAAAVSLVPPAKAGRAVALVNAGVAPALTLGLPAATAAGTAWGWRWPFAAATVALVALAVLAWRVLPDTAPGAATSAAPRTPDALKAPARPAASVLSALRGRGLQLVGLTTVVLTIGHYSAYTYITPILLRSGIEPDGMSWVLLGYGLAGTLGLLLAGVFADRYPKGSLRVAVAVTAAALLALAVLGADARGAVSAVLLWGVAFSALPTLLNAAALRVSTVPDAAPAVVNAMFNVGIASGAWAGGLALQAGGTPLLAALSAVLVALSLPLTRAPREPRATEISPSREELDSPGS